MEGISGIVHTEQTNAGKPMFEEGRKLYTEEINAAVRGAKASGATEIVVMDCHGAGDGFSWNSLIAEELDPDCEFVVQDQWTGYTAFLESGCDAALFDLKAVAPYDPGKPCEVKVEYKGTTPPQRLRFQSGVEFLDDRTIVSRGDDWWMAWKQFFFAAG